MSIIVKTYPDRNIAGILNKSGSYSKQTPPQRQGIVIEKDNDNTSYSPFERGYTPIFTALATETKELILTEDNNE